MQPAPFTPDDLYCVYCHAPAVGACAGCGALCCADCVELARGVITPRAVCRSCLRAGQPAAEHSIFRRGLWFAAGLVALLATLTYLFLAPR